MARTGKKSAGKNEVATAVKTVTQLAAKRTAVSSKKGGTEKTGEELVVENLSALCSLVETLGETLDMIVEKAETMACHIIATEEMLAELVASEGINLARVNARIRAKIAAGTDNMADSTRAIDIAAAIASPLPRN